MNRSENGILFDCTEDILNNELSIKTSQHIFSFVDSFYLYKGVELTENYSRDNFCGVFCHTKKFYPEYMSQLPLSDYFNFKHHHALKPDWFIFFLYAKYPLIGIWFMPIASLAMIFGALRIKRNGVIHTSGLILSFLKFNSFKMPITKFIINWRVNHYKELKGFREVFRIYHEKDRPEVYQAFLNWEKRNANTND